MSAAVSLRAVSKYYGGLCALDNVEFSIARGEFFGLLGPNGAGKSTLINIMAGLTRAQQGEVAILGHDVVKDYRRARCALGVVPQELVFDPFFTIRELLRIQSGYFGLGRDNDRWIDELLEALMLTDKANANMRSLSGGMKRRALIAQALVHKPPVVVLDEPTAGVDVDLRRSLWQFVQRLHRDGHTIVLTTHYLEEAEMLCDRIGILDHGRLVALDTKQGLLARGIAQARICLTTRQVLTSLPSDLAGAVVKHTGNRLELQLGAEQPSIDQVLESLRRAGAQVIEVHTQAPDLEDIFLGITRKIQA